MQAQGVFDDNYLGRGPRSRARRSRVMWMMGIWLKWVFSHSLKETRHGKSLLGCNLPFHL